MAESKNDLAGREVDISSFSVEQLAKLRQNLEEELELFSSNGSALRMAQSRYDNSLDSLQSIKGKTDGHPMLVPLTSSLYAPGKMHSSNTVLVDIGTGYYAKKQVDQAADFIKRKLETINKNVAQVMDVLDKKQKSMEVVTYLLSEKLAKRQEEQQQAAKGKKLV